jgi:peptidoglycan hydrolase-like protein with peptidoglycan-binding domain
MTRLTLVAIACAIAACSEGGRDRLSQGASDAAAGADSVLRQDLDTMETAAAPGADTEGGMAADTAATPADTVATPAAADTGGAGGTGGAEAMGGVPAPTTGVGLSADQVRQLQAALNDAGCDAGPVDGVVGPRTRQGITCGLDQNNLRRDDVSGLYRALGLQF